MARVLSGSELANGTEKIQNFEDAKLAYQPEGLELIIGQPLLKPDGKIYSNKIIPLILDAQEKKDLLRVEIIDEKDGSHYYLFLQMNSKTVAYQAEKLQIGNSVKVIGRYSGNIAYTTLMGIKKIAPKIDVMYIEPGWSLIDSLQD